MAQPMVYIHKALGHTVRCDLLFQALYSRTPSLLYTPMQHCSDNYTLSSIVLQNLDKGQDKETAFVRNLRSSIRDRKPLRVNRRGLVKLSKEIDRPVFNADELYSNRQRGLSCKAIAKRVGVDTSKDEVVQISRVLKTGCGKKMPDIESIETPYKRALPTPMWYLWDSELEVIEDCALPSRSMVMSQNPHVRIVENLGDDSCWMLQVYLMVVHGEIMHCFHSAFIVLQVIVL